MAVGWLLLVSEPFRLALPGDQKVAGGGGSEGVLTLREPPSLIQMASTRSPVP